MTSPPSARYAILAALTWHEARDFLAMRPIGLLPVGALEAHGPHLPLDTDVIIADATADTLGALLVRQNIPAARLPAISYSASFVGTSFPGTTPVSPAVLQQYLTELLTHAATQGYRALVICNAHLEPVHIAALIAAATAANDASSIPVLFTDQRVEPHASRLSSEFAAGARHAGNYETSILLAAAPSTVRVDLLPSLPPVWVDLPAALRAGATTFSEAGMTDAYVGDPASATAAEGHRLLGILAEIQIEALQARGVL